MSTIMDEDRLRAIQEQLNRTLDNFRAGPSTDSSSTDVANPTTVYSARGDLFVCSTGTSIHQNQKSEQQSL